MATLRANSFMAEIAAARGVEVPFEVNGNAGTQDKDAATKKRDVQDTSFAILRILEELSLAFCWPRQPLAVGIYRDIRELLVGEFKARKISGFLHWFTSTTHYLEAVSAGHVRLALDGTPTDPPTEEHRESARQRLAAQRQPGQPPRLS